MLQDSLFWKKFSNVAEIKMFANAADPTDVTVLPMSWVSFHLDYYVRHVKLNVLGRIAIPD